MKEHTRKIAIPSLSTYLRSKKLKNLSNPDCLGIWHQSRFRDGLSKTLYHTGFGFNPYATCSLFQVNRLREIEQTISDTLRIDVRLTRSKAAALNWVLQCLACPEDIVLVAEDLFLPAIEICELNRLRFFEISNDNLHKFEELVNSTLGLCIVVYNEGTSLSQQVMRKAVQLKDPRVILIADISLSFLDYLSDKEHLPNHVYLWDFSLIGLDTCCAVTSPRLVTINRTELSEPPYVSEFLAECVDYVLTKIKSETSKIEYKFTFKEIFRQALHGTSDFKTSSKFPPQRFFAPDSRWVEALEFTSLEDFAAFHQQLMRRGYFLVPTQLRKKGEMLVAGLVFNNDECRELVNDSETLEMIIRFMCSEMT